MRGWTVVVCAVLGACGSGGGDDPVALDVNQIPGVYRVEYECGFDCLSGASLLPRDVVIRAGGRGVLDNCFGLAVTNGTANVACLFVGDTGFEMESKLCGSECRAWIVPAAFVHVGGLRFVAETDVLDDQGRRESTRIELIHE